jgi:hypothetical protein
MTSDTPALGTNRTLDSVLTERSLFVKQLCPEAAVGVTEVSYDDEDGNIFVRPPEHWTAEECDALEERLSERSIDIPLQTGYHVLVGVFEPALK